MHPLWVCVTLTPMVDEAAEKAAMRAKIQELGARRARLRAELARVDAELRPLVLEGSERFEDFSVRALAEWAGIATTTVQIWARPPRRRK